MPFVCCQRLILLQFTAIHGVVDLLHLWFLKTVHKDRPVNVHHQDHSVHQGNKSFFHGERILLLFYHYLYYIGTVRHRRGHDGMVVGFTTTCAISAYHHKL